MPKFLNERPMSELVWDGRLVMFRTQSDYPYIIEANESERDLREVIFKGWVEIYDPKPNPDANGWWKWEEVTPDPSKPWIECFKNKLGEVNYVIHNDGSPFDEYDATSGGSFEVLWKYLDLPIES